MIARFTFPSKSINCNKVTSSLMSFSISKLLFFFYIVRLYCRFYSPFIFLLFFIIVLEKWFLLLNISVYGVNDSSIRFIRAATFLFSPIHWKSDAKLLKQQLLDLFWQYFISGASVQNLIFLFILALLIGTPNFW